MRQFIYCVTAQLILLLIFSYQTAAIPCNTTGLCGRNYNLLANDLLGIAPTCTVKNIECPNYDLYFFSAPSMTSSRGTYTCAAGKPCYIDCAGGEIFSDNYDCCRDSTFNCADGFDCTIVATNAYVLRKAVIRCPATNGVCTVNSPSGKYQLTDTRIYCPSQEAQGNQGNCIVKGTADSTLIGGNLHIYVREKADLSLECNSNKCGYYWNGEWKGVNLYCGSDYSDNCELELVSGNNQWQCVDRSHICNNYYLVDCNAASICAMDYTDLEANVVDIVSCAAGVNSIICSDYHAIVCDTTNRCNSTTIDCEAGKPCYIQCIGDNVCEYAVFNCPDNGYRCTVRGKGARSLEGVTINGKDSSDLFVYSRGTYTVTSATVNCGGNADCVIIATKGHSNLFGAQINAQKSNVLNITTSQTSQNLAYSVIRCPESLLWGTQQSCNIHMLSGGNDMLKGAELYAMESFTDVSLYCKGSVSQCSGATMHCGLTHEYGCNMTLTSGYDQWNCTDTALACHDYQFPSVDPTLDPTSDPTNEPTDDPTTDPTLQPSVSPTSTTSTPSNAPTSTPTAAPTSTPTDNTTAPTSTPSSAPTSPPTFAPSSSPSSPPSTAPSVAPTPAPTPYCSELNIQINNSTLATAANFNGVYRLNENEQVNGYANWRDTNKNIQHDAKGNWVINGEDTETLSYASGSLYPPLNEASWTHSENAAAVTVDIQCLTDSPTSQPSVSPTPPTSSPTTSEPTAFQPTVAPVGNLHLIFRYTDRPWSSWYSFIFVQETDYGDMLMDALDDAFQAMYGHSLMYSQTDIWTDKSWERAGIINVNLCKFSDVILSSDCPLYEAEEDEYVAVAVFGVTGNGGLDEYVLYLQGALQHPSLYREVSDQMNSNANVDDFELVSLEVVDTRTGGHGGSSVDGCMLRTWVIGTVVTVMLILAAQ